MKKIALIATSLAFTATAAYAQPAADPATETPTADEAPASPADAAPPPEEAAPPADAAAPAEPAAPAGAAASVAAYSDEEIDNFAEATVKVQAINKDAAIAADQKQSQMQAAVTATGLDAAKYNAISKAAAADPALRTKIQTAMSKYATPPQG